MFLDPLQRLGVVYEHKDVAHRGCQSNDLLVAMSLVYEHLCEQVIRDNTTCEGQTYFVHD